MRVPRRSEAIGDFVNGLFVVCLESDRLVVAATTRAGLAARPPDACAVPITAYAAFLRPYPAPREYDHGGRHLGSAQRSAPWYVLSLSPRSRRSRGPPCLATECSGIASRRSLECPVPDRPGHTIKDRSWLRIQPIDGTCDVAAPPISCMLRASRAQQPVRGTHAYRELHDDSGPGHAGFPGARRQQGQV